jgi:hypothetical protein
MSVNDATRIVIDNSRVTLEIATSLTDNSRGVIYNRIMFKAQATDFLNFCSKVIGERTPWHLLHKQG